MFAARVENVSKEDRVAMAILEADVSTCDRLVDAMRLDVILNAVGPEVEISPSRPRSDREKHHQQECMECRPDFRHPPCRKKAQEDQIKHPKREVAQLIRTG